MLAQKIPIDWQRYAFYFVTISIQPGFYNGAFFFINERNQKSGNYIRINIRIYWNYTFSS